ncbi:MAG: TetR/AcrR family transcriptional regulator [Gemmatimonadaceae bacterium]
MDKLPGQEKDGETEQKILEAAQSVFIRRGTAGARMAEIAQEAGVNQALLHYYFRTKERLSIAVFSKIAGRLFPSLRQLLGSDVSLDDKIDRLVALYLDNLSKHPYLPGYVLSELHHHPERIPQLLEFVLGAPPKAVMSPVFEKLGEQIDERVAAGTMRPISPEQFAINLISLCIFPFAARPMLRMVFGMDDDAFARFIEQRKTELPEFFRNALRP